MTDAPPKAGLEGVAQAAKAAGERGLPPVHLWNPPHCGEIDIRIRKDGVWFHEGAPIGREALVRLFSTVLRLDPDRLERDTPLRSLGVDSLMAIELRNRLELGLGLTLSATLVWTYTTLGALVRHLGERMGLSGPSAPAKATPAGDDERAADGRTDLAALSDQELIAELANELSLAADETSPGSSS